MSAKDKPDAWMPLFTADWDSGTRHLTCEEDGAYGRLVRHYWRNGPLPDDDAQLARIIGEDRAKWRRLRPVMERFFELRDGHWFHKRVERELADWTEKRRRFIARAAAGGRARAAQLATERPEGEGAAKAVEKPSGKPAKSSPQALLKPCTPAPASASAAEERPLLRGGLSASGRRRPDGLGPRAVRPPCAVGRLAGVAGTATPASAAPWPGPPHIRALVVATRGEAYAASYLDPSGWDDAGREPRIIPRTGAAAERMRRDLRALLEPEGVRVAERAA